MATFSTAGQRCSPHSDAQYQIQSSVRSISSTRGFEPGTGWIGEKTALASDAVDDSTWPKGNSLADCYSFSSKV